MSASMLAVDLLTAATREDALAVRAASQWLNAVDFENLRPEQYRLLPLAARTLMQAAPGDPRIPRVQGIYRRTWYANQLALRAAQQVILALAAAKVPVLLADALALSQTVYGQRLRPIAPVTLIVKVQHAEHASQVLAAGEWKAAALEAAAACGSIEWENRRQFRSAEQQCLDLCWHVAPYWPAPVMDDKAWGRAQAFSIRGTPVNILSPADQFVRSCRAASEPGALALVSMADVAAQLAQGKLDWEIVLASAETCRVGHSVLAACQTAAEACGVAAPPAVVEQLRQLPPAPFGERVQEIKSSSHHARVWRAKLQSVLAAYRRQSAARGKRARLDHFLTFLPYRSSGR